MTSGGLEAALELHEIGHLFILGNSAVGVAIGYCHFLAELLVFETDVCGAKFLCECRYSLIEVTNK